MMSRYARHHRLPGVGIDGQKRLSSAKVLVVGVGGLGSPILMYLAAAGVGEVGFVDHDLVDLTNLQRQVIHSEATVEQKKVDSALQFLKRLNSEINYRPMFCELNETNAIELVQNFDVVIDATDNFKTRYLLNDACFFASKPLVSASILQFEGQLSVFNFKNGPCYRCLYPQAPPSALRENCSEAGVFGILPGILGTLQANEAIKMILGIGKVLSGNLLCLDALGAEIQKLQFEKNPNCKLCGSKPSITFVKSASREIDVAQFAQLMKGNVFCLDVRSQKEYDLVNLGSHHIPLDELSRRHSEIPKDNSVLILCHHGSRSLSACELLTSLGFQDVKSVAGGIDAYALRVDPTLRRYT